MAESQTPPVAPAVPPEGTPPASGTPTRPEDVAEDHWDAEKGVIKVDALAQSYQALRKKMSADGAPRPGQGVGIPQEPTPAVDDNADIDGVLTAAGLNPREIGEQWLKEKELKSGQYQALKKAGYTRGLVDQFLKLQTQVYGQAQINLHTKGVELAGGEQQFETLMNWARQNLTAEERKYYDLHSANAENAIYAFEWLLAKHKKTVGAAGATPPIEGGANIPTPSGGYANQAEMLKAMQDKRYKIDKGYTKQVDDRIAAMEEVTIAGAQ